ncbi:MAG: porin family protein [Legionellaceae bacterium]|nr:porin family protein [Legionellaceae bacterium]
MKKRILLEPISYLTLILLTCSASAGDNTSSINSRVLTISGGPAWYHAGKTQTLYIQPDFPNTYVPQKNTDVLADGELFAGFQRALPYKLLAQLGITIAATTSATEKGSVWEFSDPIFDNFIYQYHISHLHTAIKGKVLGAQFSDHNLPYISGSAGVGFNRAYDYNTTPQIFEVVSPPNFQANTETTFTYTLGIGIQHVCSPHTQIGIGYEFADWGKSRLLTAVEQRTQDVLQLNHLYTNQLQFNVTFIG